jgi:hypothetical protein
MSDGAKCQGSRGVGSPPTLCYPTITTSQWHVFQALSSWLKTITIFDVASSLVIVDG